MRSEPSEHPEVESVVESVRRGDRAGLERLFSAHRPYLKHVVTMRMGDELRVRLDPSDVVQDAQLEALRRVADYIENPKLPVRLWLRKIAVDRLMMAHRRHVGADKRSVRREFTLPEHSSLSIARQLVAGTVSPSMAAAEGELVRKVREAIAALEENDREIILLQAFEGLTSSESGQVLGIEPAAARKRFGRALLRLRQRLEDGGLGGTHA
jgi:RNA polymerase sigma-70 factor (ECF subfamily)